MAVPEEKPASPVVRELVVGGVVLGAVGWAITRALDGFAAQYEWPWWSYAIGVGGGLALLLVGMTIFRPTWREKTWAKLAYWQPFTTQARLKRIQQDAYSDGMLFENGNMKRVLEMERAQHETAIDKISATLSARVAHIATLNNDLSRLSLETAAGRDALLAMRAERDEQRLLNQELEGRIEKLMSDAKSKPTARTVPPLPRPRWITAREGTNYYSIRNAVPRSVAREVRIESDADMTILDAGVWDDLSVEGRWAGRGPFTATATPSGRSYGVRLTVSWYDENGTQLSEYVMVSPEDDEPDPF